MVADADTEDKDLRALAEEWNAKARASRKSDGITEVLAVARTAMQALEAAIGPRASHKATPDAAQIAALKTMRKIAYNCAADAYPGWEVGTPPRTEADLAAAEHLAEQCLSLDDELAQDAEHHGHSVWLIGALNLAQGRRAEAQARFRAATEFYTQAKAPLMAALAKGYIAIAAADTASYNAAVANIGASDEKYAKATQDQLITAHQIYGGKV
jgi:hypothetical protein